MKVKIHGLDYITLVAENDAEKVLLDIWYEKYIIKMSACSYSDSDSMVQEVTFEFEKKEN